MLDDLVALVHRIISFFADFFVSAWDAVKDWCVNVVFDVYDANLTMLESVINAIPVPDSFTSNLDFWSGLPGQAFYILGLLKIHIVLAVIFGAYTVRFLLNLIPSWATRA